MTSDTPERPKNSDEPNKAGMGKMGSSADDQLIQNDDEFYRLRELAMQPDPPATLVCKICERTLVKNMDTIGMMCHGEPMHEEQRNRAVDADIIRRILQSKK